MGLKSNKCPSKEKAEEIGDTQEGHVKTEAEIKLYGHKAKSTWSHQKLEEARKN